MRSVMMVRVGRRIRRSDRSMVVEVRWRHTRKGSTEEMRGTRIHQSRRREREWRSRRRRRTMMLRSIPSLIHLFSVSYREEEE